MDADLDTEGYSSARRSAAAVASGLSARAVSNMALSIKNY
jgi:hypothetical protein